MASVALKRGMVVGMTHEPFDYTYFPIDAVISLAGTTLDGFSVEIGTVGHGGYLGLPMLFGKRIHLCQATVQHHGSALRVPGGVLEDALHASRTLYEQHTQPSALCKLAQTAVCHRFHSLEQRLCQWLLSMHDRVRDREIQLTHGGLAHLIGGRRPMINTITNEIKKSGIVECRRGSLVIRDRTALERLTCECYLIIAQTIRGLT
jgi:CRP-like cAMP-binding protein